MRHTVQHCCENPHSECALRNQINQTTEQQREDAEGVCREGNNRARRERGGEREREGKREREREREDVNVPAVSSVCSIIHPPLG
jgi:hypothetical protein